MLPEPGEAKLTLPGLALAWSMSSLTLLGGNFVLATSSEGMSARIDTGVKSCSGLTRRSLNTCGLRATVPMLPR